VSVRHIYQSDRGVNGDRGRQYYVPREPQRATRPGRRLHGRPPRTLPTFLRTPMGSPLTPAPRSSRRSTARGHRSRLRNLEHSARSSRTGRGSPGRDRRPIRSRSRRRPSTSSSRAGVPATSLGPAGCSARRRVRMAAGSQEPNCGGTDFDLLRQPIGLRLSQP
jgi:hypothetical protein